MSEHPYQEALADCERENTKLREQLEFWAEASAQARERAAFNAGFAAGVKFQIGKDWHPVTDVKEAYERWRAEVDIETDL